MEEEEELKEEMEVEREGGARWYAPNVLPPAGPDDNPSRSWSNRDPRNREDTAAEAAGRAEVEVAAEEGAAAAAAAAAVGSSAGVGPLRVVAAGRKLSVDAYCGDASSIT